MTRAGAMVASARKTATAVRTEQRTGRKTMAEYIDIDGRVVVTDTRGRELKTTVRHILEMNKGVYTAADVRPVVTCADCKYNTREVNDLFGNNAIQCITGLTHRHDWFCADGKKREES